MKDTYKILSINSFWSVGILVGCWLFGVFENNSLCLNLSSNLVLNFSSSLIVKYGIPIVICYNYLNANPIAPFILTFLKQFIEIKPLSYKKSNRRGLTQKSWVRRSRQWLGWGKYVKVVCFVHILFGLFIICEYTQAKLYNQKSHRTFTDFLISLRRGIKSRQAYIIFQTSKFSVNWHKGTVFKIFVESFQYRVKIYFSKCKHSS